MGYLKVASMSLWLVAGAMSAIEMDGVVHGCVFALSMMLCVEKLRATPFPSHACLPKAHLPDLAPSLLERNFSSTLSFLLATRLSPSLTSSSHYHPLLLVYLHLLIMQTRCSFKSRSILRTASSMLTTVPETVHQLAVKCYTRLQYHGEQRTVNTAKERKRLFVRSRETR